MELVGASGWYGGSGSGDRGQGENIEVGKEKVEEVINYRYISIIDGA